MLAASGTAAQIPAADTITITGTREAPAVVHQHAIDFVHATGVAAGEVAAARWIDPVCPRVVGITDAAAAAFVEEKVRSVAADAGIAAAPAPCAANIAIVFAADGGAVVRDMVVKAAFRFHSVRPATIKTLIDGTAPIRWWYTSDTRDKDGSPPSRDPPPAIGLTNFNMSMPAGDDAAFVQHRNTSLVSTEVIRVLHAATVVIDVTRTDGLPLSAVASFAAMVALAEIRAGAAPPDSVLGLFGGGAIRRSPSAWDVAFLRALYRLPLDRTAQRQRGRLVAALVAARTPQR